MRRTLVLVCCGQEVATVEVGDQALPRGEVELADVREKNLVTYSRRAFIRLLEEIVPLFFVCGVVDAAGGKPAPWEMRTELELRFRHRNGDGKEEIETMPVYGIVNPALTATGRVELSRGSADFLQKRRSEYVVPVLQKIADEAYRMGVAAPAVA